MLCLPSYALVAQPAAQADSKARVDSIEARYELAGKNRSELEQAIKSAPVDQRAAVEFLILNMRKKDLQSLSADFLLDNVRVAYEARAAAPWADQVSDDLFLKTFCLTPTSMRNEKTGEPSYGKSVYRSSRIAKRPARRLKS